MASSGYPGLFMVIEPDVDVSLSTEDEEEEELNMVIGLLLPWKRISLHAGVCIKYIP